MSNLLAMPQVSLVVETGNNEDWLDSLKFLVEVTPPAVAPQLDIRGIAFEMEIRRKADDTEVILTASTANGRLVIGTSPDYGFLMIKVPVEDMRTKVPGSYVADIIGTDGFNTRVIATMALTIVDGVTK